MENLSHFICLLSKHSLHSITPCLVRWYEFNLTHICVIIKRHKCKHFTIMFRAKLHQMGQKMRKKVFSLCNILFRAKLNQMGQKMRKKVFSLCNIVLKCYHLNVSTLLLCSEQSYIKWDKR